MTDDKKAIWKEKLAGSRTITAALLASLRPEQWDTPVYSEGQTWTVKTIISHLIDSERGMSIHIHKIRKGEPTLPEGFDLDRWNQGVGQRVGDLSPHEFADRLTATRARTLEGLETLTDGEWLLTGRHASRGIITIEQYYETIVGHELDHIQAAKKALGLD
jgi:hypothetical protein